MAATVRVRWVETTPPAGWDARAVDAPGGSVRQGTAWAAHRGGRGWDASFVTFSDDRVALVFTRRRWPIPGRLAYSPRGPVSAGDAPERVADRVIALRDWLAGLGAVAFTADPELSADAGYESRLAAAGFREAEESQAERHRMVLDLPLGADEQGVLAAVAKTTRQRIRGAERAGTSVAEVRDAASLAEFAGLYAATARRREFWVGDVDDTVLWWRRVIDVGQGVLLAARHDGRLVGGLFLYRQGGRFATAYSADDASTRRAHPGTMHLLRWTAIRRAIEAGDASIDLGGVDLPGARRIPQPGEPTYGLYEHKRSFGAHWVECAPAHEVVLRPWVRRARAIGRALRGRPIRRPPA